MASGYTPIPEGDSNPSVVMDVSEQNFEENEYESQCWGCGSHLILPYLSAAFKCGWCGAVTFSKPRPPKSKRWLKCALLRDRLLVAVVFVLIASVTGGGLWAVYPVLYPQPSWSGYLQIFITTVLACTTIWNYSFAAFVPAGSPAKLPWGSVEAVGKAALNGYTYCIYCCCPKPPQAHHCRTCGTCVMDMDHHCPFIGNCVGANNHRHFILFLVYTMISSLYVLLMSVLAGMKIWPALLEMYGGRRSIIHAAGTVLAASFLDAFEDDTSVRSLALIYLIITALAILIGLALLLRQQLQLLYEGQTYVESIQGGEEFLKPGWHNLRRLFGKRHPLIWLLPGFSGQGSYLKLHSK